MDSFTKLNGTVSGMGGSVLVTLQSSFWGCVESEDLAGFLVETPFDGTGLFIRNE